jgi:hypothetical protein
MRSHGESHENNHLQNRRNELRCVRELHQDLVEKEPGVRMASVSFTERLARFLHDPQAVKEEGLVVAIQQSSLRVVGREAAGETNR